MNPASYDVVAIGNAIVDVIARADDAFIAQNALRKGSMQLLFTTGEAESLRRAMVAELQSFARELVASLRFYQEQPKSLGIVEILITGGAAACGGLAPELERLIGIPVRVADPLTRVKLARGLEGSDGVSNASMAVAVGLGIED